MSFHDGEKVSELPLVATAPKRMTGTTVRFLPDEKYFGSPRISIPRLKHVLRAKAVLCSGLRVEFVDNMVEGDKSQSEEWCYEDGLTDYLTKSTRGWQTLP